MSISGSLSNALSGLSTVSKAADVASTNVANATTDGYARRELQTSSRIGGGVQADALIRSVDKALLADRRTADADTQGAETRAKFYQNVQLSLGEPGSGYSLSDQISRVEAELLAAAARPESEVGLQRVLTEVARLATQIVDASDQVQSLRGRADAQIATDIETLNSSLAQIETLNYDIRRMAAGGGSAAGLLDARQNLIDQVSEIVPVREIDRGNGILALMTTNGTLLLDGSAPTLEFTPVNVMTPHLSYAAGTLSGITLDGEAINLDRNNHPLSGGRLGANLDIRDSHAPEVQEQLDGLARNLMERFEDLGTDPSLAAGDPGLLTDNGLALDISQEVGLAGRLAVNALADPEQGGEIWRLRDGLGAAVEGDAGQAVGLQRLASALSSSWPVSSGGFQASERSAVGLVSDLISGAGGNLALHQADLAHSQVRLEALTLRELENGVDTDQEMQNLLLIEQAYAANARVITTIEDMLDTLMRL